MNHDDPANALDVGNARVSPRHLRSRGRGGKSPIKMMDPPVERRDSAPWLALPREGKATVLPRGKSNPADAALIWYGTAPDGPSLRRLAEDLLGFAGPTYSTFRGELARPDPADPAEAALLKLLGGRTQGTAVRFTADVAGTDSRANRNLFALLERVRRGWERRPTSSTRRRSAPCCRPAGRHAGRRRGRLPPPPL